MPAASGGGELVPAVIVLAGSHSIGKTYRLEVGEMMIGRSYDCQIWLDDEGVSRHHAKFVIDGQKIDLVDLGSKNGTYVNGDRVEQRTLKNGDKILLGSATILKFNFQDALDEALQRNLYESATKDGMTGAYNKRSFTEMLKKEFAFAARHGSPLSVVLLDLDHFKVINDTYGHQAGDGVLMRLSQVVLETIRTEDLFCRFGGEEFAVLLRQPEALAVRVADRMRHRISTTRFVFPADAAHKVTVSVGVASIRDKNFTDADAMLAQADRYLYEAKNAGRNQVRPDPAGKAEE